MAEFRQHVIVVARARLRVANKIDVTQSASLPDFGFYDFRLLGKLKRRASKTGYSAIKIFEALVVSLTANVAEIYLLKYDSHLEERERFIKRDV